MKRLCFVAIIIAVSVAISSCNIISKEVVQNITSQEDSRDASENTNTIDNITDMIKEVELSEIVEDVKSDGESETEKDVEPLEDVDQKKSDEQQKHKSKKLDYNVLDKLSNKQYSWSIRLNKENEPTQIGAVARKLLEENDGIYLGDTSKKSIYLTFDEGYENGYTPMILDTLKDNDVKAMFFVTWPYAKKNKELIERMLAEGHIVGNHTLGHKTLTELDNKALEEELYGFEEKFLELYGVGFNYMRPPLGIYSEKVLAASKQLGYKTVFWSFAYRDFDVNNQKGADYAYKMVMDNLHNGAVILLHAISKDNTEALDRIIKDIKAQGYNFSLQ